MLRHSDAFLLMPEERRPRSTASRRRQRDRRRRDRLGRHGRPARGAQSPMRLSAARPRSPARVPCIPRAPWQSRAGSAVCLQQVSEAAVAGDQTLPMSEVGGACVPPRIITLTQGGRAGVRARHCQVHGARCAARARGSGRSGRLGGVVVAAVGVSEPRGRAIVGRMCACVEARGTGGEWRGSACARSEPPLPRAMGRTCAGSAFAMAVPRVVRCAARFARSVTCVLDAQTAQYRVRCDMF